jgi:hypothetical protein
MTDELRLPCAQCRLPGSDLTSHYTARTAKFDRGRTSGFRLTDRIITGCLTTAKHILLASGWLSHYSDWLWVGGGGMLISARAATTTTTHRIFKMPPPGGVGGTPPPPSAATEQDRQGSAT